MNLLSLGTLLPLAGETVRAPRRTLARLTELPLSTADLWQALTLVVVLSVLLAEGTNLLIGAIAGPADIEMLLAAPLIFGAVQFAILAATIFLIDRIGRAFGGTGTFREALLAVTWLQFMMVCLQAVQSLAILLLPALAALVMLGGLVLYLGLLTCFIAEMHGFRSLGRVFGMILFVLMGVALGLMFMLTLTGVTISG